MDLPHSTPSPAPAEVATEETSGSIIPEPDRDRWLTVLEVQEYLQLAPPDYVKLVGNRTIPYEGKDQANRLHPREALRDLLVQRVGEAEAKRAWQRLEDHWEREDQATLQRFEATALNAARKAQGLPPITGYVRRADPLEGRSKPAASPEAKPEAPRRAYWDDAADAIMASHRAIAENQAAERQRAAANRVSLLSTAGLRRSTMSADQKAAYLEKYGQAQYFRLPK